MPSLDIFSGDAFNLQSLTAAINAPTLLPGQIGRISSLGLFAEQGITTTVVSIERDGRTLTIVPATQRGAPGTPISGNKRSLIPFHTLHLPQTATILADEVQNVRAFGTDGDEETVLTLVNQRLATMRRNLDLTNEWHRAGALKGQILDANGSTVLLDLFTSFGVSQIVHFMALEVGGTDVQTKCKDIRRKVEDELDGLPYTSIRVLASRTFMDALSSYADVKDAWNFAQAQNRISGAKDFTYGDVVFEEYHGKIGSLTFIPEGEAIAIPEGVPDLFITRYAPGDYMETVNTIGLPYYARQEPMDMNKGVEIEAQSNPLHLCTRPRTILRLKKTAS